MREPFFRRPAQAQRCRWLLWFWLTFIYECMNLTRHATGNVRAPVETLSSPNFQRTELLLREDFCPHPDPLPREQASFNHFAALVTPRLNG